MVTALRQSERIQAEGRLTLSDRPFDDVASGGIDFWGFSLSSAGMADAGNLNVGYVAGTWFQLTGSITDSFAITHPGQAAGRNGIAVLRYRMGALPVNQRDGVFLSLLITGAPNAYVASPEAYTFPEPGIIELETPFAFASDSSGFSMALNISFEAQIQVGAGYLKPGYDFSSGVEFLGIVRVRDAETGLPITGYAAIGSNGRNHAPVKVAPNYTFVDLGPSLAQGVAGLDENTTSASGINDSRVVVGLGVIPSRSFESTAWRYSGGAAALAFAKGSANGINNSGVIVGSRTLVEGTTESVRVVNGAVEAIVAVPGSWSQAWRVSDTGYIVGDLEGGDSMRGYRWFEGSATFIGEPNGYTEATGVNDAGDVVGASIKPGDDDGTAFLWKDGMLTYLTEGRSRADDINNHGVIVGSDSAGAFSYSGNTLTRLEGLSGYDSSEAVAINDAGVIVGRVWRTDPSTFSQISAATAWFEGEPVELGKLVKLPANWRLDTAMDVNNHGDIVGYGFVGDRLRAFLLQASPTITQSETPSAGGQITLSVPVNESAGVTYRWQRNGNNVGGASNATLTLTDVQPADAGLYHAVVTSGTLTTSEPAIVGVATTGKVIGAGEEIGVNIPHPNTNIFDQVLLTGVAETITADFTEGQITRTSFIDLDGDIVQVEFSGPGTLSLVLDTPTGPAAPVNYNQPTVSYMRGHAGIVITGADERTNVSVFTVGRATAFDPSGNYNILEVPSATNVPANNGSALFVGHGATDYDGIADIAFIAISTTNGKFGGLRTSNTNYFASKGITGVYAPGVAFQGPVFIGDISAYDDAKPMLVLGAVADARITGGDLLQANGAAVDVSGLTQLKFTAGGDSHGRSIEAKANAAVLREDGVDVTSAVVVNP